MCCAVLCCDVHVLCYVVLCCAAYCAVLCCALEVRRVGSVSEVGEASLNNKNPILRIWGIIALA